MNERAQMSDGGGMQIVIVLVIAVAVAVVGVTAIDTGEIQQQTNEASAYCYQVYGNSATYNAMAAGGHGGLHCVNNAHGPHLHEIPWEYVEQAYHANQSGDDLGWDVATASAQATEKPDEIPVLGLTWGEFKDAAPVALGFPLAVVGGAYVYGRRRRHNDD